MNIIKHTDSYKLSHFKQYPENVKYVSSYIEARTHKNAEYPVNGIVFFGLQAFVKKYLMDGHFLPRDIDLAAKVAKLHGVPFNEEGWRYIFAEHEGRLPIIVEGLREGSVVPFRTPMVQIHNTDPKVPWLTSYLETALLRAIWYPTTVATLSYNVKRMMKVFWDATVDRDTDAYNGLDWALHDFGARGVSSQESAELGAMGHLLVFNGSDTFEALYAADRWYPEQVINGKSTGKWIPFFTDYVAGGSVPAAEHSTITSWGPEAEDQAFSNMIDQFGEGTYSVVSDSYDIFDAVRRITSGELLEKIKAKGGRFVIRPDSGDPVTVIRRCLGIIENNIGEEIKTNGRGYKVLPKYLRIIQGDGCDYWNIHRILKEMQADGWSAENFVFGMGGALLQKVDRDTLSFAMKCNAVSEDMKNWTPVFKKPVTDKDKISRAGRIQDDRLKLYYLDGLMYTSEAFSSVKKRVNNSLHSEEDSIE